MNSGFLAADLRRADPDRYLLTLFAPRRSRAALTALFLFNHEISRTRFMVTDTTLGLIRLQWWRDEIGKVFADGHGGQIPWLSTLAPLIHQQCLPQELFDTLIYAHEFDLENVAPANVEGLKNYADFTTTPLNVLALKIIGDNAENEEIRQISINFGLIKVLRSVPFMLKNGFCLLPQDHLTAKKLTAQKIIDYNHQLEIIQIIKELISHIDSYSKPQSAFLKIQQTMTHIYRRELEKKNFDVFSANLQMPPPFFALRLALGLR